MNSASLLIGCQHDLLRPLALERALSKLIPGVRYVEVESGHFMHVQTPELFTHLAVPFLAGR